MKQITAKAINDTLKGANKPTLYTSQPIPLNDLTDRCFEILLYYIFGERLRIKDTEIIELADNVSLMQGVGEQGRDVILSFKGINTGIIQCKKHKSNITKPDVTSEILKFILYYIKDNELIGDLDKFCYYFAASTGFSGSAIGAFNDFGKKLSEDTKLKDYIDNVIEEYPLQFKVLLSDTTLVETVKNVLSKIKIKKIIPQDIEYWLSEFETISKHFFKILTVTDNTLLEQIINSYLKPIVQKLDLKNIDKQDFTFRVKDYLKNAFDEYSSAKTLVFGNQQKKLEEIYFPLSVAKIEGPERHNHNKEVYKIDKYNDNFIPIYKKILIVDNGGMGKSTLLKWLFLSVIKSNKGIPIFIELRKISANNTLITEITKKLNPLNQEIEEKAVAKMLSEEGFIIFLDGYDEIKDENRPFVSKELKEFVTKCSKSFFIMTSRPEKALTSFAEFQAFSVCKLEEKEAYELIKKLDNYQEKSLRLIDQIENRNIKDIEDFLSNPLLVSLLYKKFEYRETLPFRKQEFYYEVFEALFQAHDLSKGESYIRDKESKLSLSDFFQVLRGIGFRCIKDGIEFNEAQLMKLIDDIKKDIHKEFDTYSFLNDITKAVPLFQKDGLIIKWAHKSIQQYFAAEYICRDSKSKQEKILLAMYQSAKSETYVSILELCYEIDYKSFKHSIIYDYCKNFIEFHNNSFQLLKKRKIVSENLLTERIEYIYDKNFFLFKNPASQRKEQKIFRKACDHLGITETGDVGWFGDVTMDKYTLATEARFFSAFDMCSFLYSMGSKLISNTIEGYKGLSHIRLLCEPSEDQDGDRIYYFNDDNVNNPVNYDQSFEILTSILKLTALKVNYKLALQLIEEIDNEIKIQTSLNDFVY